MIVHIHKVKKNAIKHRTVMVGLAVPAWWEVLFLFRWRSRPVAFVGNGTKWYEHPHTLEVSKQLAKQLTKRYQYFLIYGK
jgi:hypothetical protein